MADQPETIYDDGDPDDDECCAECDGEGGYHECGEDSCCCLYHDGEDEDDYWITCPSCHGTGY
jgi:hypothetical protein